MWRHPSINKILPVVRTTFPFPYDIIHVTALNIIQITINAVDLPAFKYFYDIGDNMIICKDIVGMQ